MTKKRAVIVGINDYPSAPLRGCVNDVETMSNTLTQHFGFVPAEKRILTNKIATTSNIMNALMWLTDDAQPGDILFFHYSGHGSRITHTGSDVELNGYDEILCPVDLNWKDKMITDDDLRIIFDRVPAGVNLTIILDCCHSGTALDHTEQYQPLGTARNMLQCELNEDATIEATATSKMLPPPTHLTVPTTANELPRSFSRGAPEHVYAGLLISGCQSHQTSADAFLGGKYCGAATSAVIESMERHNFNLSHKVLIEEMNEFMVRNRFTQRPELDFGNKDLIDNIILKNNF